MGSYKSMLGTFLFLFCLGLFYQNFSRPAGGVYRILVTPKASNINAHFKTDSLPSALEHIRQTIPKGGVDSIEIMINGGVYQGVSVQIQDSTLKAPLFIRAISLNNKPIFDGLNGSIRGSSFLKVTSTNNLYPVHIQGLKIQNYNQAISFSTGSKSTYQGDIIASGHHIEDCDFLQIGNRFGKEETAYAAVRLQNVSNSFVLRNTFNQIISDIHPGLLHSIYVAHLSSNNLIAENKFNDSSGDWIRLRNRSHNNQIRNNEFTSTKSSITAVATWFDAEDSNVDNRECPSFNNTVQANVFKNTILTQSLVPPANASKLCPKPPSSIEFVESQNINADNGLCKIQSFQDCPSFDLKANQAKPDFLKPTSSTSLNACSTRAGAYYNSCQKKSNTEFEIYQTSFQSTTLQGGVSYAGKGCLVEVQNCDRMKKTDLVPFVEAVGTASVCQNRATAWYNSCSKDDSNGLRLARTIFVNGSSSTEKIVGNGCLIRASHCPRMNFADNQVKVDIKEAAHASASACMSRIQSYMSSCLKDGNEIPRTIEAMYFSQGKLIESQKATSSQSQSNGTAGSVSGWDPIPGY